METYIIIFLCIASFVAGFIDAIVGGGGLIQTPAEKSYWHYNYSL